MQNYKLLLHQDGPALWPTHKSVNEVLHLKATTPDGVWAGTYQGSPTPPSGSVFKRSWWYGKNRYGVDDLLIKNQVVGRWISWDTALKDKDKAAYTVGVVGELWPDYRMGIRYVVRKRLEFPHLPDAIDRLAMKFAIDGKLRGVLIEDKASGTSAYQTLRASSTKFVSDVLVPFSPIGDKHYRAEQGAVWCKNNCVMLPQPSSECLWLADFEEELFDFPNSAYMDQVDALSQLIIYMENLLAEGWRARNAV